MTTRKAKKKPAKKKKPAIKKRVVHKVKAKPRLQVKSPTKPQVEVFDEIRELQSIETFLNLIYGHLRRIQREGGEDMLKMVLSYFHAKHNVSFFGHAN